MNNAEELAQLRSEVERLRGLAATCYAGLGAECNLPEAWLDVLNAAASGEPFSTDGLLPYTAEPPDGDGGIPIAYQLKRAQFVLDYLHANNIAKVIDMEKAWAECNKHIPPRAGGGDGVNNG